MSEPFLAEVKLVSFNYAPRGWATCNGQLLPINQNQALFSLLGTTYGGNGQTTFALPDLRGRVPFHVGGGHAQGEKAGAEAHTLSQSELPAHTHIASASSANATNNLTPTGNLLAVASGPLYGPPAAGVGLNSATISTKGGSQPHQNMQPFLVLNFVIALQGIYPSQN